MSRPAALIVDDQPIFGLVASDILQESGYESFHACDANHAAAILSEHPEITVLVTEAELPGNIDGVDLVREVSQTHPGIQLIVTSVSDVKMAEFPEATRLLRKPFASGELRTAIGVEPLLQQA